MSLNFVSSAVLTSTDGVSHNEEKAVETTEAESLRRQQASAGHRPLFEQLRSNAEKTQEERDAAAKALRGTRTLDEEDCAHLDSIERQRMERDMAVRRGVEEEVAAFRAARAERMAEGTTELLDEGGNGGGGVAGGVAVDALAIDAPPAPVVAPAAATMGPSSLAAMAPKIVIKKKRRRQPAAEGGASSAEGGEASKRQKDTDQKKEAAEDDTADTAGPTDKKAKDNATENSNSDKESDNNGGGGLGGLLGAYGSDSDSD